jgi:hypothetical protein
LPNRFSFFIEYRWRKRETYPRPPLQPSQVKPGEMLYKEYFDCSFRISEGCMAKKKVIHKRDDVDEIVYLDSHTCLISQSKNTPTTRRPRIKPKVKEVIITLHESGANNQEIVFHLSMILISFEIDKSNHIMFFLSLVQSCIDDSKKCTRFIRGTNKKEHIE